MNADAVQELPPLAPARVPGALLRARGRTWRLLYVTPGAGCRALHLVAAPGAGGGAARRVLLEPFDRCEPVGATGQPRAVTRRAWVARLASELCAAARFDAPRTAVAAGIDLHGYQLEPVVRLLRGDANRVLLADAVGLGKTVQAGLAIAEVMARRPSARVLVVVPAGLRDQWAGELRTRFSLEATRCDAAWLAVRTRALPPGANPWSIVPLPIVSIDFVKRPEVLNALDALEWDLLVADEVHLASAGSDRGTSIAALARRAHRVVLASATPHDGDPQRFEALCRIGAMGPHDPLLVFRRDPSAADRPAAARPRVLRVAVPPSHLRMHALLDRYAGALAGAARARGLAPEDAGAALALSVLRKRALSSAHALWLTALRRRRLIASAGAAADPRQSALPFTTHTVDVTTDEDDESVIGVPGLPQPRREAAWLGALAAAAHHASREEPKLAALLRWLRRTTEPLVVFTEYRDTLGVMERAMTRAGHRVAVLHGAQADADRASALSAFAGGQARVLAATDTASEGLNLQARCRAVACFDVPWSPTRLAQRIGRVDRLGQRRRAHALLLAGAGTGDVALLARLDTRAGHIASALAAVGSEGDPRPVPHHAEAKEPLAFLLGQRRLARRAPASGDARRRPATTTLRLRSEAWPAGEGLLWIVAVRMLEEACEDEEVERHLVAVFSPHRGLALQAGFAQHAGPAPHAGPGERPGSAMGPGRAPRRGRERSGRDAGDAEARWLLADGSGTAIALARASLEARADAVRGWVARRRVLARDRAAAIAAEADRRLARDLVQPGLFDRPGPHGATAGSDRSRAPTQPRCLPPSLSGEEPLAALSIDAAAVLLARVLVRPPRLRGHREARS
jgi:superfamily II DNA or RNA helicase